MNVYEPEKVLGVSPDDQSGSRPLPHGDNIVSDYTVCISGQVTNDYGTPLYNARVTMRIYYSDSDNTDLRGKYSTSQSTVYDWVTVEMTVTADGYFSQTKTLIVYWYQPWQTVNFCLTPSGFW